MTNPADHLQQYDRLRDTYLRLGLRIAKSATNDEFMAAGTRLGFLRDGQLTFTDERDSNWFTDGVIFLTRRDGHSLAEIARDSWTDLNTDETQMMHALADGRWGIHEVLRGLPGVGLYTRNCWTGAEDFVYARIAGSTCSVGDLLLFRTITCQGITQASAGVMSVSPELLPTLRALQNDGRLPDDATLALGGPATDNLVIAELVLSNKARIGNLPEALPALRPPRIGRNAPCPCGSGQKYKRCCGR
jgi:hypothetical protein